MAYRPIDLPTATPPEVLTLVRRRVDVFCADINALLHFPMPAKGIIAGCNFAATECLCSIISGISRVFLDPRTGSAQAFREILQHYPDELLPNAVGKPDLIEQLYKTHRCNFSHSLGINVPDPKPRNSSRRIEALERRTKILRLKMANAPEAIAAIESDGERPEWLPPTISRQDDIDSLCVESLYRGVRELVKNVSVHSECCEHAVAFLRSAQPNRGEDTPYPPVRNIPLTMSITFEVSSYAAIPQETSMPIGSTSKLPKP